MPKDILLFLAFCFQAIKKKKSVFYWTQEATASGNNRTNYHANFLYILYSGKFKSGFFFFFSSQVLMINGIMLTSLQKWISDLGDAKYAAAVLKSENSGPE